MRRAATLFELQRHDGACSSAGGPVAIDAPIARPIDEREVELAIRRLRARIQARAK